MASPLTPKQWEAIRLRLLAGEKGRSLAREFGISETAIRKRFGSQTKEIKKVANQLVKAEEALSSLPISSQISARTLADELKAISSHLAGAGKYGAMTAHRLSGMANDQVDKIDDVNPSQSTDALQNIAILTKLANDSSVIGIGLLNANKEYIKELNNPVQQINHTQLLKDIAACLPD
jgi:AraC-like DNA-binding protein